MVSDVIGRCSGLSSDVIPVDLNAAAAALVKHRRARGQPPQKVIFFYYLPHTTCAQASAIGDCVEYYSCCHRLTFTRHVSYTIHRQRWSSDFVTKTAEEKRKIKIMICFAVKRRRQRIMGTDVKTIIGAPATVWRNYTSVLKQTYRPTPAGNELVFCSYVSGYVLKQVLIIFLSAAFHCRAKVIISNISISPSCQTCQLANTCRQFSSVNCSSFSSDRFPEFAIIALIGENKSSMKSIIQVFGGYSMQRRRTLAFVEQEAHALWRRRRVYRRFRPSPSVKEQRGAKTGENENEWNDEEGAGVPDYNAARHVLANGYQCQLWADCICHKVIRPAHDFVNTSRLIRWRAGRRRISTELLIFSHSFLFSSSDVTKRWIHPIIRCMWKKLKPEPVCVCKCVDAASLKTKFAVWCMTLTSRHWATVEWSTTVCIGSPQKTNQSAAEHRGGESAVTCALNFKAIKCLLKTSFIDF